MPNPEDDYVDDPFPDEDGTGAPDDDSVEDPFAGDDGEPDLVAETQAELGDIGDIGAGVLDGLLMNYGGELADLGIGAGIGNVLPKVRFKEDGWPELLPGSPWDADGVNPFDDAQETSLGTAGNIAGNVASGTALGLATGGVGGIAAQAGIQGGAGAVAGYGANHDPYEALMGGGIGALFGGAGRAIAGKVAPKAVSAVDDVRVHAPAAEYPPVVLPGELQGGAGVLDDAMPTPPSAPWAEGKFAPKELDFLQKMFSGAFAGSNPLRNPKGWMAGRLLGSLSRPAADAIPEGATAAERAALKRVAQNAMFKPDEQAVKNIMGNFGGASALTGERLQARPDLPTLVWGLQSVNASGDTGLPQKAQERLDAALASGDDSNVSSVYMSLSMAHPGFQRRMQREIESINDESG